MTGGSITEQTHRLDDAPHLSVGKAELVVGDPTVTLGLDEEGPYLNRSRGVGDLLLNVKCRRDDCRTLRSGNGLDGFVRFSTKNHSQLGGATKYTGTSGKRLLSSSLSLG